MSSLPPSDEELLKRLNENPLLKARMINLLDVVTNAAGDVARADAAERRAIEELREMGQEVLQSWAERQISASTTDALSEPGVQKKGKKSTSLAE